MVEEKESALQRREQKTYEQGLSSDRGSKVNKRVNVTTPRERASNKWQMGTTAVKQRNLAAGNRLFLTLAERRASRDWQRW